MASGIETLHQTARAALLREQALPPRRACVIDHQREVVQMSHWYAVQTKSRQEQVALEHLKRQAFVTYLPLIKAARHRRGRWQGTVEPLFPGYLFVELDFGAQNTAPIRSTRGVIGLVRFGQEPRPVPHTIVQALLDAQSGEGDPIDPDALFKEGDRVTLVEGPMKGLSAIVQARTGKERVVLLLELLGRENRVTVLRHQIVPAC